MPHRPRKRFGQNFLTDPSVIDQIINAFDPLPGEHIIEIGPGKGILTKSLLELIDALDVIELDRDLIPILEKHCAHTGTLMIHNVDVLDFDFADIHAGRPLRIIGNLPYNISTSLLFHLIEQTGYIMDMHFMLQKEVAERLIAKPGRKDYGRLSVMVQYYCHAELLFTVDPESFSPKPKVDSAFIRLKPYADPRVFVDNEDTFRKVVKQAFSQRRKTLLNNFKGLLDKNDFNRIEIDHTLRAEVLSLEHFARLSNYIVDRSIDL